MIRFAKYPFELILVALFAVVALTLGCGGSSSDSSDSNQGVDNDPPVDRTTRFIFENTSGNTGDFRITVRANSVPLTPQINRDGVGVGEVFEQSYTIRSDASIVVGAKERDGAYDPAVIGSAGSFSDVNVVPSNPNNETTVVIELQETSGGL